MSARRIVTERVYPPIPDRKFDWRATFEGYDEGDPMGYGPTREAAIADLILEAGDGEYEIVESAHEQAKAEADTRRYRWLRQVTIDQWDKLAHYTQDALDKAIDDAIAKAESA